MCVRGREQPPSPVRLRVLRSLLHAADGAVPVVWAVPGCRLSLSVSRVGCGWARFSPSTGCVQASFSFELLRSFKFLWSTLID